MERWPALTGMRGVAALLVVLFHVQAEYHASGAALRPSDLAGPDVLRYGWIGVDFFFVLSAFLLAGNLIRRQAEDPRRARPGVFWLQRFLRIAPPYYASFLLALAIGPWLATAAASPRTVALHLAYLQNLDYATMIAVNPIYWTLAVEAQFYLLLPWLVSLFSGRRTAWALAAFLAAAVAWRVLTYQWAIGLEGPARERMAGWSFFALPAFLGHFALGVAAARWMESAPTLRRPTLVAAAGALAVAAALAVGVPGDGPLGPFSQAFDNVEAHAAVRVVLAAGFAAVVVGSVAPGSWAGRLFLSAPVDALGAMSYSLYLLHGPLLVGLRGAPGLLAGPFATYAAAGVAASVVGCGLFYLAVEEPALLLRDRFMSWFLARRGAAGLSRP